MSQTECIVGIDLGTTNSEVAAYVGGRVEVLGPDDSKMLPSCVGLSPGGELLVGAAARNQQLLYPDLTVRSVKRKMGMEEKLRLGDKTFSPPEISALILRELAQWAARRLGVPVNKAVITVPAYFSDAQRHATREAGALAGLDVVRILNEPTAASLAYGYAEGKAQTVMVYDLGGGTFDVSIVHVEGDVTEVLASHGNNQLGGDDFNDLLVERLVREFQARHGVDLRQGHRAAFSRLWWAAEEAKKKLSEEPYVRIREEALATVDGKPLHLEWELSRGEYEEMIRPLVESTLDSVTKALDDAGKKSRELDAVLLVGGSTRTPLVWQTLEERTGAPPRQDVHPDLCVALGAGVLASRLAGHEVERILVDVSPFSFGPSYLGRRGGVSYPYCYHPIIRRNTPLPVTRTDCYATVQPYQIAVDVQIYQGDDADALKNIPVGSFKVEGLRPIYEPNEVLCRMSLDLDGILHVSAIEKETGLSKHITIENALTPKSPEEIEEARKRLEELFSSRAESMDEFLSPSETEEALGDEGPEPDETAQDEEETQEEGAAEQEPGAPMEVIELDPAWIQATARARALLERSRGLLEKMHAEDRDEAVDLHEAIEQAIQGQDPGALTEAVEDLKELLFFVEGKE